MYLVCVLSRGKLYLTCIHTLKCMNIVMSLVNCLDYMLQHRPKSLSFVTFLDIFLEWMLQNYVNKNYMQWDNYICYIENVHQNNTCRTIVIYSHLIKLQLNNEVFKISRLWKLLHQAWTKLFSIRLSMYSCYK